MGRLWLAQVGSSLCLLLAACDPAPRCLPGASVACVGPGGCSGAQICAADGHSVGPCDCGGVDAGAGDAGALDRPDAGTMDAGALDDTGGGAADALAAPTYLIADWQLRCASTMPGCTPAPYRQVTGIDGEAGNSVSCTMVESATERTISFSGGSAASDGAFLVALTDARVPRAGGVASSGLVRVEDSGSSFAGACGTLTPSTTQPCRVEVAFSTDLATGSPLAEVRIACDELPLEAVPTIRRSLWASPGSTEPGTFLFYDCVGQSAP